MHIISAADFSLFSSNSARSLILPAEWSLQKSLILLEILLAELIQSLPKFSRYELGYRENVASARRVSNPRNVGKAAAPASSFFSFSPGSPQQNEASA